MIAFFYGQGLSGPWLARAGALTLVLFWMNRSAVGSGLAYGAVGAALWYALHLGGIHATIAGVVVGLVVPARPARRPRQVLGELAGHVSELDSKAEDEELDGAEVLGVEKKRQVQPDPPATSGPKLRRHVRGAGEVRMA